MPIVHYAKTGDLDLKRGLISGPEYVAQRVNCRLKLFLGEWFLDRRIGVPYYRDILRKGADRAVVRSVLRRVVAETPGVASVEELIVGPGDKPRSLAVTFSATSESGEIVQSNEAFIV